MLPGWFARNCELMILGQFLRVMNSRRSLGPPLTIRPARWAGLFSRLKAFEREFLDEVAIDHRFCSPERGNRRQRSPLSVRPAVKQNLRAILWRKLPSLHLGDSVNSLSLH